jgi:hypothetical protein
MRYQSLETGRDSSVGIATRYGLRRSGDRIPLVARFSAPVHLRYQSLETGRDSSDGIATLIFLAVLYGCETWSRTPRKGRRLKLFENMVLRSIFGPNKYDITRELRKLYNEEFNDLYSSPSIFRAIKSRRMRWAVHVARMG